MGDEAMFYAVQEGLTEELHRMIVGGADVMVKDVAGLTALHFAADNGRHEASQMLLGAGADVEAKQCDLFTPLHYAAQKGHAAVAQVLVEWSPPANAIGRGSRVRLKGLVSRADLNGKTGTVSSFDEATTRFGVRLTSGENLAVRSTVPEPATFGTPVGERHSRTAHAR